MDKHEFTDECLREHNKFRQLHGIGPLRHSIHLDKTAQEWADDLVIKETLVNSPVSSKGEVGENISMRKSTASNVTLSGTDVAKQWYDDSKNYDFVKASGAAGNFTQMIWKSTDEVGFGIAHSKGKCIVVAHYKPPGNIKGNYLGNVLPLVGADNQDQKAKIPIEGSNSSKLKVDVDRDLTNYMALLTHSRTSSMSSDESFERHIQPLTNIEKARKRELRQFVRDTITAINAYRAKHQVPKLKHNKSLDHLAQGWADELVQKSTLSNSNNTYKDNRVGENIASRWSNDKCDYTADQVADHWYSETSKYSFDKEPPNVQGIGNFTQMVWKSSTEIGIGKAYASKEKDFRVIVVCNYYPAGNVLRRFRDNVFPALK